MRQFLSQTLCNPLKIGPVFISEVCYSIFIAEIRDPMELSYTGRRLSSAVIARVGCRLHGIRVSHVERRYDNVHSHREHHQR